jgi:hypothetical protein
MQYTGIPKYEWQRIAGPGQPLQEQGVQNIERLWQKTSDFDWS